MKKVILKKNEVLITKSKYAQARTRDNLSVWLDRYKTNKKSPQDKISLHLMEEGRKVEKFLIENHPLFKNGYMINSIKNQEALDQTREAILNGEKIIYQAALYYDQMFIRIDILKMNEDGNWEIFEVKSSTNEKKKRKEFVPDLAIQKWVGENTLSKLDQTNLVYLNKEYLKQGKIDCEELFKIIPYDHNLREEIKILPNKVNELLSQLEDSQNSPVKNIGSKCKSPECQFKDYCWFSINKLDNSVENLTRITDKKRNIFKQEGILEINQIPDVSYLGTSKRQKIQLASSKKDKPFLDKAAIANFINDIKYPLYFFDVETLLKAIPVLDNTQPLEQIVFQISLHIVEDEKSWDNPVHKEFLLEDKSLDPRPLVLDFLKNNIKKDEGKIVVYHKSFEKGCLNKLKNIPNINESDIDFLDSLIDRLYDLEDPFSKTFFYDNQLKGSSSIKKVLPLFDTEDRYAKLSINNGSEAQFMFIQFFNSIITNEEEIKNLFKDLKDYCHLDTLAMVIILKELIKILDTQDDFYWFEEI